MSREQDFQDVRASLAGSLAAEVSSAVLAGGDSLILIRSIPDHSAWPRSLSIRPLF